MCCLFFIFGITTGWATFGNVTLLEFTKEFGSFLAVLSALVAVTITIGYKEYLRFRKIKGLENICQLELQSYSTQIQEFFLFFQYNDGIFFSNPDEWKLLSPKFPEAPELFKNYDLLLELNTEFVTKIAALIRNRVNIKKLIRKIDDLFSVRDAIYDDQKEEILKTITFLQEQFCADYNNISTTRKFSLPKDSIYRILRNNNKNIL